MVGLGQRSGSLHRPTCRRRKSAVLRKVRSTKTLSGRSTEKVVSATRLLRTVWGIGSRLVRDRAELPQGVSQITRPGNSGNGTACLSGSVPAGNPERGLGRVACLPGIRSRRLVRHRLGGGHLPIRQTDPNGVSTAPRQKPARFLVGFF